MLIRQQQVLFQITDCFREVLPLGGVPSSVQLGKILLCPERGSHHKYSIKIDGLFRGHINGCAEYSKVMQMGELG